MSWQTPLPLRLNSEAPGPSIAMFVSGGSGESRGIIPNTLLKVIAPPPAIFAVAIAARSDPGPESAKDVTTTAFDEAKTSFSIAPDRKDKAKSKLGADGLECGRGALLSWHDKKEFIPSVLVARYLFCT